MRPAPRIPRAAARAARLALAAALWLSPTAGAQVSPNKHYFTLHTTHFYIHFTRETELVARRVAVDAERAYAELASELHPPRGAIDVVITDDVDFSNGSATPFPSNRITVYANPPIQNSSLRFTDDWGAMAITHELTHIFHLDRTRGLWLVGQYVFGRSPYLFPNSYDPSWLVEGLAVYYESHFTGAGRIEGSEHRMIARASAIDHSFPTLGEASLASPRFPFGESAYAYGSLFVDYLAKTRGEQAVRRFVEKSSADIIPFWIDLPARQGFGISFTRAYREWRDSIYRSVSSIDASATPLGSWHDLTREGVLVSFPRWLNDSTLAYTGTPGKEVYAAWQIGTDGERRRIGRRNSESPQVELPTHDGVLYAQLEYTSPYEIRSDLYVQRGGRVHRLTHGARLSVPDVRADGEIVAVQTLPGSTRLVRVSPDGRRIEPLTSGTLDIQWNEPRWSHRGDRIAAIRWRRPGLSEIVVLDSAGRELGVFATGHSVQAAPSWMPDDAAVMYSSDRTGTAQLYLTTLADGHESRASNSPAGLLEPSLHAMPRTPGAIADGGIISSASIDVAAVSLRGDGYHLGFAPCCALAQTDPNRQATVAVAPIVIDSSPAAPYSPWRQLLPLYWEPSYAQGLHPNHPRIGAETGGYDIIGRHSWDLTVQFPTDNSGVTGSLSYAYAGLGMPVIDVFASRDWSLTGTVVNRANQSVLGEIRQRVDDGEVDATWVRQRYRSAFAFTAGSGVEQYNYVGAPNATIALVDTTGIFNSRFYPRVLLGARYARTQQAPYSISPEDGFTLAATARERWRTDIAGSGTLSLVSAATGYKSLNLPGFAHHVIAVRAAGGWRDDRSNAYFDVGGISGAPVPIIAGYTVGEGSRDFFVRGFQPGSLVGTRAVAGSAEYRLPLVMPGRAPGVLPLFIQRAALNVFTDYGSAWCPSVISNGLVCTQSVENQYHLTERRWLGSYGAELNVTAAVLSWDAPYRFRFGAALPYQDEGLLGPASKVSWYFASGLVF